MEAPSRQRTSSSSANTKQWQTGQQLEQLVLLYWALSAILGGVFLYDWITAWNVGATLGNPWLVASLVSTWLLSQIVYMLVARHDDRPFRWKPTVLFALGNGICETFAFALVYRLGSVIGVTLMSLFLVQFADITGFLVGSLFFVIYGGLIHGLFWIKLLPPHFDDSPQSRRLRRFRPLIETALVLSWTLCFWLYNDIWTVAGFHILVDFVLMFRVRPPLFAGLGR
ncbi:MAG: hypothetical protein HC837_11100 [Chloroflexaceae bacterium]|nr:hypothetical protein [Chloroflexaceae bacterium]